MVATRAMRRADYKSIAYLQWSISPQLAITPKLLLRALPSVFALSVLAHTPSNVSSSSTGDRIPRIHSIWRSTALFHVASAPRLVKIAFRPGKVRTTSDETRDLRYRHHINSFYLFWARSFNTQRTVSRAMSSSSLVGIT